MKAVKMKCPQCGTALEKRIVPRGHMRRTSVRYNCPNENCSVIFLEKPREGEIKIVYDPTMEKNGLESNQGKGELTE